MTADILVRPLHTLDEFRRCVQIAREVWGDSDLDTEPYVTLVIADHTGGQVLGAFDGDLMVGFTKAYVGLHGLKPYLHSHMTGVLPSHRDRRVGRYLKLFQREEALRRGIRLVEWTFDPLETKNAHFNINRLGAICRRYIPNFYGITTSPLHRGLPTDRLLVEWHLDTKRVIAAVSDLIPEPHQCPAHVHLPAARPNAVPVGRRAEPAAHEESGRPTVFPGAPPEPQRTSPSGTTPIEIQSRIRVEFTDWFSKGYAVLGVRSTASGVDYCLAPYSDF
jgi:predicted GNAT superfamily acetyltransferase